MSIAFTTPAELLDVLAGARRLCVFSGAGVSAESGIATFRQPDTGLWSRFDPLMLATLEAFQRDPALVWGWYEWRRAAVLRAQPNPAHHAIAGLAARLPQVCVVTQNVDDLHERAGARDVVHLHGSLEAARCSRCAAPYAHPAGIPAVTQGGERMPPPACAACGGPVRPGVVWFGESLPMQAWARAEALAREADVFLCVGTSGLVYPAASLPQQAARAGAAVIQVNPDATPLDGCARWNLRGPAGAVMPALLAALG
ncbi:NAD-dependent deacylase [Verticiella sediminum]|uniref:NAD-dependent protein deacylase n=1 Tax=Verticiella sediminum TaxID=1247510 RepID=A0A556ASA8_9BURK|nr:NAD-dependent deacylase [Verticiella sediminum]TSH95829.1 NAD-dependent deacylase [Verticiella sediminum]